MTYNEYDEYNLRYWKLTDKITHNNSDYQYCVEGCADFHYNKSTCKRCAKFSDVYLDQSANFKNAENYMDIPWYYLKNNVCYRRQYVNEKCIIYSET